MCSAIHQYFRLSLIGATCLALSAGVARAQEEQLETVSEAGVDSGQSKSRIIVPVPIGDPQLGGGFALAVAWFYQPEGSARPWSTGVGAMRTSNKSWGVGVHHSMSLAKDRFRIELSGGYGQVNLRYYGSGTAIPDDDRWVDIGEETAMLTARARARVVDRLFIGGRARYLAKTTTIRESSTILPQFDIDGSALDLSLVEIGPIITFDSTRDAFNPRRGTVVSGQWFFAIPVLGSDLEYDKGNFQAKHYLPVGERNSVALRARACSASDNAPFFDLCGIGLRGYSNGRFRDLSSWSAEAEWRQHLGGNFGVVAFAGVGATSSYLGDAIDAKALPAAGLGIRYLLSESYGINLRVDGAIGRDSEAIYVSIGESF